MKEVFERENIIKGICRYQEATGMSKKAMARQIGISATYFRRLMREQGDFGPDKLYRMGLLGMDLNTLVMGLDEGSVCYQPSEVIRDSDKFFLITMEFLSELPAEEKQAVIAQFLHLLANQMN